MESKVDVDAGVIRYVNAGHPSPLVIHKDGSVDRMDNGGPLLGFDRDFSYSMGEISLQTDDLLLLYTDGVTEIVGRAGQLFDESGLIAAVQDHLNEEIPAMAEALMNDLLKFNRSEFFQDDLTFILARYTGSPSALETI
jgi:sigma-B regulation protein RsbU (phosphoserine phosphatase)